jgi:hypothetical protein
MRHWGVWGVIVLMVGQLGQAAPVQFGLPLTTAAGTLPTAAHIDTIAATGVRLVRIPATWTRLQPQAARWDFAWLDSLVARALAQKLTIVLVLGPAPRWAVSYLPNPTPAQLQRAHPDLAAYQAYAAALARRYANRVTYYQLWDRPTSHSLLAVPQEVHRLFRAATKTIHAVDPRLRVIAPEPGDLHLWWLSTYLSQATPTERPDVLLLAPLRHALTPAILAWRLQVLRTRVLPSPPPQLWATMPVEAANPSYSRILATALLHDLTTVILLPAAAGRAAPVPAGIAGVRGLLQLQGYERDGYNQISAGVVGGVFHRERTHAVLAIAAQDATLALVPGGQPPATGIAIPAQRAVLVTATGTSRPLKVLRAISLPITPTPAVLFGGRATPTAGVPANTPSPVAGPRVSVVAPPDSPSLIRVLRTFPRGNCQQVEESGHPVLMTSYMQAPWIYFDLPDGFLFFNREATPVRVTVHVLGASDPRKTGFSLYYDSLEGKRNAPWQWIDVGPSTVFTYSLVLNDALFATDEGYDIRLDMGGSKEGIRLVDFIVEKLTPTPLASQGDEPHPPSTPL